MPARRVKDQEAAAFPTEAELEPLNRRVCSRMRQMRKARGCTLEQLSSVCGVSRSMLSQIERGSANPTLGVAFRIAQAFGLSLGDLVDGPASATKIEIIRADDRTFLFRSDKDVRIRTLSPLNLEKDVEFYEILLRPGGVMRSEAHFKGTREFLTIEKGTVRLTAGNQVSELSQGDSAHYPADVPHAIENIGDRESLAFLVDIYER